MRDADASGATPHPHRREMEQALSQNVTAAASAIPRSESLNPYWTSS
jgi:hypothetical protein